MCRWLRGTSGAVVSGMASDEQSPATSLNEVLDRIEEAAEGHVRVTLGMIVHEVGDRSFGPLLLLAGLITLTPLLGDIPGVPTTMGLLVVLTAGQLLIGRDHFWFPRWVLDRGVGRDKLEKATGWLRKPAGWVDRMLRARLTLVVSGPGKYVTAVACLVIGAAMPAMDFVPFSANGAGAALTVLGLALIARDGLVALVALAIAGGTFWLVIGSLA